MHKVQVTPVIGLPKFSGWSSVISTLSGTVAIAVAIDGANAHNIGREVVSYLESAEAISAADLNNHLLNALTQVRATGARASLAAVGVFHDQIFFAAVDGAVLLKRGTKIGVVLQAAGEVVVKEGKFDPDDILVLSTKTATDLLGEVKQKFQQGFDVDTVVTSIVPSVHRHGLTELMSLGFVTLSEQLHQVQPAPVISFEIQEDIPETPDEPVISHVSQQQLPTTQPLVSRVRSYGLKLVGVLRDKLSLGVAQFRQKWLHFSWRRLLRKWWPWLVVVVVSILGGGAWWLHQLVLLNTVKAQTTILLSEIGQLVVEIQQDPVENRSLIQQKRADIEKLQHQYSGKTLVAGYFNDVLRSVDQTVATVSGQANVAQLPIFVDLRQISSDWIGQRMDSDATQAAILDSGKQELLTLHLISKELTAANLNDTATASAIRDIAVHDGAVSIIGPGVREVVLSENPKQFNQIIPEGDSNREASLVSAFGPYRYVLNPVRRNIYRYTLTDKGASQPIGWVVPGEKVAYDQVSSMAVDGDMWLGLRTGAVVKLTGGRVQDFEIRGLHSSITSSIIIYTKDFLDNLYILEPAANRVIVVRKNGDFIKEFTSTELGVATDIIASEDLGVILVVSGSAVFSLAL